MRFEGGGLVVLHEVYVAHPRLCNTSVDGSNEKAKEAGLVNGVQLGGYAAEFAKGTQRIVCYR